MKLLLAVLLSAAFTVCADDFKKLCAQYNQIESFYKNLSDIQKGTPRYEDLGKHLSAFQKSAAEVQRVTDTMPCMDDLAFARYAEIMTALYREYGVSRRKEKEKTAHGSLINASEVPFKMMFELLESDIEELQDIGFSPGSKTQKTIHSAELWPEYYQYHRFLRYYRAVGSKIKDYSKNLPWRNLFAQRMKKMQACAAKLKVRMQKDFPGILKTYDPVAETEYLAEYFYESRQDSLTGGDSRKTLKVIRTAGSSDPERDSRQNMSFSARRLENMCSHIRRELKKIDQAFEAEQLQEQRERRQEQKEMRRQELRESQEALRKAAEEEKKSAVLAGEKEERAKRPVPLERMSEPELRKELENRRNEVFPSSDQKTLRQGQYESCLATLSKDQQEMLESIRLRHLRAGEKEQKAQLESLRELRPLLETKNLSVNKKEILQLLKNGEPEK